MAGASASLSSSSSTPSPDHQMKVDLALAAFRGSLRKFRKSLNMLDSGRGQKKKICESVKMDDGQTLLHLAASNIVSQNLICKYLIEDLDFDVDSRDWIGQTPLALAISSKNHFSIEYLIQKGADLERISNTGESALHYAVKFLEGHKMVQVLLLLISRGADVNSMAAFGTPLQQAIEVDNTKAVRILLDNNAKLNILREGFPSALGSAVRAGSLNCIDLLLKAGADPDYGSNGFNMPPLSVAACMGKTEIIGVLLKAGAQTNIEDDFGLTPLEEAAIAGDVLGANKLKPFTAKPLYIKSKEWGHPYVVTSILALMLSQDACTLRYVKQKQVFITRISRGKEALEVKDYGSALQWFLLAKTLEPRVGALYADLSHCWACMDHGKKALAEAQTCLNLKPGWMIGHLSEAIAWKLLRNYDKAVSSLMEAFRIDIRDKNLENKFDPSKLSFEEALSIQELDGDLLHEARETWSLYEAARAGAIEDVRSCIPWSSKEFQV